MKVLGIVAEYNPFHNGHKYHIAQSKQETGCDTVVCVMSGSFVQRGETAVYDKWTRARAAILCGADLVLELPAYYVLQSSDQFASAAIKILDSTGIVDFLSFGSESGNLAYLQTIARQEEDGEGEFSRNLRAALKQGLGYPAAYAAALEKTLGYAAPSANDCLGSAYIRALEALKSRIVPHCIKRHLTDHANLQVRQNFATASYIRQELRRGKDISAFVPVAYDAANQYDDSRLEPLILGFLRTTDRTRLECVPGMEPGLSERLMKAAKGASNLEEFYALSVTKRYTKSRICRVAKGALLGMDRKMHEIDYLRVLAFNDQGRVLLKMAKTTAHLPFVLKTADFCPGRASTFSFDCLATDLASLANRNANNKKSGADYTTPPVYVQSMI